MSRERRGIAAILRSWVATLEGEATYEYSPCLIGKAAYRYFSSLDSGLEAFSLNPTHGSFRALTFQSTLYANYVNQRFLSY